MSSNAKPECRVLQVFSRLGVGGAEVWLMALLRYFERVKDDLPVRLKIDVLLTGGPGEFDDEARALGARLFYVPYSRKTLYRFIPAFRRILASGRYHAIHDHQDYNAGVHLLFGAGHLPPIRAVHAHNPAMNLQYFGTNFVRRSVLAAGKGLVGRFATHILGTSRVLLTDYGFDDGSFVRLPKQAAHCGFDVSRYHLTSNSTDAEVRSDFGWPESAKIILFVGRLDSNLNQKNPGFALQVGKLCVAKDTDVRMLIVGGGDSVRETLEAQVSAWGLSDRIHFTGIRSDVPRLMLASNLLLFPSVGEGLGMVAVEAQAAGLRVMTSDTTPRECEVVEGAVQFLPLSKGADSWAENVLKTINLPAPDKQNWNDAIRNSAFAIENSAATLLNIYHITLAGEPNPSEFPTGELS